MTDTAPSDEVVAPEVKEQTAETEFVENEQPNNEEVKETVESHETFPNPEPQPPEEPSIANMSREELIELCKNNNVYIQTIESKLSTYEAEILSLKNAADYQKHRDPTYREKVLSRKLAMKEQEIQDYATQINELKASQISSIATLKSSLLDPAVNIIVQKLKNELSSTKASLEETQNELNAWKFTPDSNTGKRLMAKCRLLHQENEELGKMISSGRVAKLEGELALQKSFSEEVKKSQFELDELLQDLDEDVEGMQGTIYYLQQELKKAKEKIRDLTAKNEELTNVSNNADVSKATESGDLNNTSLAANTTGTNDMSTFNPEDESSNDSTCLILKVNPEEEYATMLNIEEDGKKQTENDSPNFKSKRGAEESFKNVPPKKQKRLIVGQVERNNHE